MTSYRDLIAWQRAMQLARLVYDVTSSFPSSERYGLIQQMRRAAVSIASNIAEGAGRLTTRDWQHFLGQARGSTFELTTQLLLSSDLGFAPREQLERAIQDAEEVGRIINGLLSSTERRSDRKPTTPSTND
ncbi:MAG: four helix bundle protein [Thermoanaerobaculia bacterium]